MRMRHNVFRSDPNAEPAINTTPLIDVMLVMLVMFIITIPPPTHIVDVDLPIDSKVEAPMAEQNRVTIDTADVIRWNNLPVDLAQLGTLVKMASQQSAPPAILFEPDARARYLRVDQAIGAIRQNGGERIAFPGIHAYRDLL